MYLRPWYTAQSTSRSFAAKPRGCFGANIVCRTEVKRLAYCLCSNTARLMGAEGWSAHRSSFAHALYTTRGSLSARHTDDGNECDYFKPVGEEEIVSVLIDARSFGRYEALAYDDVTESTLEVLSLPLVGEIASCRCTETKKATTITTTTTTTKRQP